MKSGRKEAIGLVVSITVVITIIGYIIVSDIEKQQKAIDKSKLITTSTSNTNSSSNSNFETTVKPDLEVLSKEDKYVDKFDYAIIGEVKNNRDYPMRNVFIRINLYDKDKKLLGDATDRIDGLDANGIWKFKAQILNKYQKDCESYKMVELTGYR